MSVVFVAFYRYLVSSTRHQYRDMAIEPFPDIALKVSLNQTCPKANIYKHSPLYRKFKYVYMRRTFPIWLWFGATKMAWQKFCLTFALYNTAKQKKRFTDMWWFVSFCGIQYDCLNISMGIHFRSVKLTTRMSWYLHVIGLSSTWLSDMNFTNIYHIH